MIILPDVMSYVAGILLVVDGEKLLANIGGAVLVASIGYCFLASFLAAKHIPVCWPDGYPDFRPALLVVSFLLLFTPLAGLGILYLAALASGQLLGHGIKQRKLRIERWGERPKQLSRKEHKVADKLQDGVEYLIFNVGLPYQMSEKSKVEGLEKIKEQARVMAREYFALTGHDIEGRIDGFLSTTWITRREVEDEATSA